MPRIPKDPEERARRNKAPTAATLPSPEDAKRNAGKIPPLSAELLGIRGRVHPSVRRWWTTVWQSPMRARWLDSDVEVLYLVALLRQQLAEAVAAKKPIVGITAEIMKQEGRVGLDVLARRRLDWKISGPVNPDAELEAAIELEAPPAAPPPSDGPDPRRLLRSIN